MHAIVWQAIDLKRVFIKLGEFHPREHASTARVVHNACARGNEKGHLRGSPEHGRDGEEGETKGLGSRRRGT
ncbi:hypothetical protein D3C86_1926460 [compost metagenome]